MNPQNQPQPVQPASPIQMAAVSPLASPTQRPGVELAISGMVFAFFMPLLGLVLSILGLRKSKKSGSRSGLALAGVIVSTVTTIIGAVVLTIFIGTLVTVANKCTELGPGTHYIDTTTKIQCD